MSEEKLEKYWNKVYYDYLEQEAAEELIDYYKNMEQENKQLKDRISKAIEFLHNNTMIGHCKEHYELLEILGDKK